MASGVTTSSGNPREDDWLEKLAKLLEEKQPYEKLDSLNESYQSIDDDDECLEKIQGSLVGLAIGDALGASVEFRPNAYLIEHPVNDMQSGGTWGLQAGQWTDDTSMALCLAASLIVKGKIDGYDQFERYKKWYRNGYMSSTGKCFDIGKSTREAITEFENRQQKETEKSRPKRSDVSKNLNKNIEGDLNPQNVDVQCGKSDSAGNGPLMRLAPIPLLLFRSISKVNEVSKYIDEATRLTHGDIRAVDACRYYAALIWGAIKSGLQKDELLNPDFVRGRFKPELHPDVLEIVNGSYKKKKRGYEDGIRGKGYVVNALEAALWAFHNDGDSFQTGVLLAVNLGDDTDTTAAIYGELAGAVYGVQKIPEPWRKMLFQHKFIMTVATGLYVRGKQLKENQRSDSFERGRDQANTRNESRFNDQQNANRTQKQERYPPADNLSHNDSQKNLADTSSRDQSENPNGAPQDPKPPKIICEH